MIIGIEELMKMLQALEDYTRSELRQLYRCYDDTFGYPGKVEELRDAMERAGMDTEGGYDTLERRAARLLEQADAWGLL